MRRRQFLGLLGSVAIGLPKAVAQKPLPRVGFLASGAAASINSAAQVATLERGLQDNGLVEGRDYVFEVRYAGGHYERFPELARELAQAGARVILVNTIASAHAAQDLVPPVPVVMMSINDPVAMGLIAGLARPGGHTTGMASLNEDLTPKLMEFPRSILPKATLVGALHNPANPTNLAFLKSLGEYAGAVGMRAVSIPITSRDELEAAFAALPGQRLDALLVVADSGLFDLSDRIAALALMHRLPTFSTNPDFVKFGGLIAYGASREKLYLRATSYVKRILDGADPGDLPVEQPSKIELWVNLKTAKALGLTIPASLLGIADEVIE
jgi:putative ABC transport system substrate-binding protein